MWKHEKKEFLLLISDKKEMKKLKNLNGIRTFAKNSHLRNILHTGYILYICIYPIYSNIETRRRSRLKHMDFQKQPQGTRKRTRSFQPHRPNKSDNRRSLSLLVIKAASIQERPAI